MRGCTDGSKDTVWFFIFHCCPCSPLNNIFQRRLESISNWRGEWIVVRYVGDDILIGKY